MQTKLINIDPNKEKAILEYFKEKGESTITELEQQFLGKMQRRDIFDSLAILMKKGILKRDRSKFIYVGPIDSEKVSEEIKNIIKREKEKEKEMIGIGKEKEGGPPFYDWNKVMDKLLHLYKLKQNTLLIGPAGTGKTQSVLRLAYLVNKPIYTINCSLRLREHHVVGRLDLVNGKTVWKKGPLPLSMEEGAVLYVDEANVCEPDVLLRIDEATDDRRQLSFEGETIKAHPDWFIVASINPLDHPGTKEMPQQLISRFTARLTYSYPPTYEIELAICGKYIDLDKMDQEQLNTLVAIIKSIQAMRTQDWPYIPTIRESITLAKLIASGMKPSDAIELTLIKIYRQWSETMMDGVREFLKSRLGSILGV